MSTKGHSIVVSGTPVEVVRKDIKNLHVGVYPPNGRVRVAAPLRLNDDAVRLAVATRLGWIRRQQAGFGHQDRQSQREMVTGETHYVQGRRYRLNVIEDDGGSSVRLRPNARLELRVRPGNEPRIPGEPAEWVVQAIASRTGRRTCGEVGADCRSAGGRVGNPQDEDPMG